MINQNNNKKFWRKYHEYRSVTLTIASLSCCIVGLGFSTKPNFPFDMYV